MKKILIPTVLLLLILSFSFYWFAWRPAQIKHECSWIKHHNDAVSARPAMTMDQIKATELLMECPNDTPSISPNNNVNRNIVVPLGVPNFCERHNQVIIDDYSKSIQAVPARDWYEKATDEEYKFCLRNKGL